MMIRRASLKRCGQRDICLAPMPAYSDTLLVIATAPLIAYALRQEYERARAVYLPYL